MCFLMTEFVQFQLSYENRLLDPVGVLDYMADIDFINYSETHLIGFQLTSD